MKNMDEKNWRKRFKYRVDLSSRVTHLTKGETAEEAFRNLINILEERRIRGSKTSSGFICGKTPAVCLQEAPLTAIAENLQYEIQTYLGADGLMHCTVCKEPVEAFYPKGSLLEMRKHHRQCACERKAYAEEAQYYKEKEHRELIARNKKICFEEKEMEGFTFQNVERDSGVIRIAEEYVTNWQKMKQNHMGYLFWGPVGTGKSYLAACIANALLEKEVTVKMTNFNTILNDLFAAEDKTEYIRSLNGYELLIIDDLGVERSSEYALENIFSVIDWRYRSGKPLIITTNLPLAQLKRETKIEKKRIYDRILERCIPVKIDGVRRREAMANDNMQTMKNILKI